MYELSDTDFSIDISSTWKENLRMVNADTQTEEKKFVERGTDPIETIDRGIQCESKNKKISLSDPEERKKVAIFLKNVAPIMEAELKKNARSTAFEDYTVNWEIENRESFLQVHSLRYQNTSTVEPKMDHEEDITFPTMCIDASWNCLGLLIAVCYGWTDHIGWCSHQSSLVIWNISKNNAGRNQQADMVLEVPSCLMCCKFHPSDPNIVAAGLFTGSLRIWDLRQHESNEEYITLASAVGSDRHQEPIAGIQWVKDISCEYLIATVSGDGKVLFWSMENKLSNPKQGIMLLPNKSYHGHSSIYNPRLLHNRMGGTSIGFSRLKKSNFVVGTEAGGVLRCIKPVSKYFRKAGEDKRKRMKPIRLGDFIYTAEALRLVEGSRFSGSTGRSRFQEVKNCVENYARRQKLKIVKLSDVFAAKPNPNKLYRPASNFAFTPHSGPVYDVDFSPFHRNLFLTCSTDSTIRLYNIDQSHPLLVFSPSSSGSYIFSVKWSPVRPLVFATADSEGKVYIYDLATTTLLPVEELSSKENSKNDQNKINQQTAIYGLDFNPKDHSLLLAVTAIGSVLIWQMPSYLCSLRKGEKEILQQLGDVYTDNPRQANSNKTNTSTKNRNNDSTATVAS